MTNSLLQAYSENPADFKPLTTEEMARIKAEKRQKDQVSETHLLRYQGFMLVFFYRQKS